MKTPWPCVVALLLGLLLDGNVVQADEPSAAKKAATKQVAPQPNKPQPGKKPATIKSPTPDASVAPGAALQPARSWETETAVQALSFSPDGKRLASAMSDGTIDVWDVETGRLIRQCVGHGGRAACLEFAADGKSILSGSLDKTMRLWDAETGAELRRFSMPVDNNPNNQERYGVFGVALTPDRRLALSATSQGGVNIAPLLLWDTTNGKLVRSFERVTKTYPSPNGPITVVPELGRSLSLSSGGRLALCSATGSLLLFDVGSGRLLKRSNELSVPLTTPSGIPAGFREIALLDVALSPDDQYAAAGCADRLLRVWELRTMTEVAQFAGHADVVNRIAFAPDGRSIATCANADALHVWDLETGTQPYRLIGHTQAIQAVTFSPDGRSIAAGGADKKIYIWLPTP